MDHFSSFLLKAGKIFHGLDLLSEKDERPAPHGQKGAQQKNPLGNLKDLKSSVEGTGKARRPVKPGAAKADHEKLAAVEKRVSALAERHGISEKDILDRISKVHTKTALESAWRLSQATELERKVNAKMAETASWSGTEKAGNSGGLLEKIMGTEDAGAKRDAEEREKAREKDTEEVSAIAHEAGMLRLVTDFDRVLDYIREKGRAGYAEISGELGIPMNKVDECCGILRDERQIEIFYPPFGRPYAQKIGFAPEATKAQLKAKTKEKEKVAEKVWPG